VERVKNVRESLATLGRRWERLERSAREDHMDFQPLLSFAHCYLEVFSG
jgi:hypothetical protein